MKMTTQRIFDIARQVVDRLYTNDDGETATHARLYKKTPTALNDGCLGERGHNSAMAHVAQELTKLLPNNHVEISLLRDQVIVGRTWLGLRAETLRELADMHDSIANEDAVPLSMQLALRNLARQIRDQGDLLYEASVLGKREEPIERKPESEA